MRTASTIALLLVTCLGCDRANRESSLSSASTGTRVDPPSGAAWFRDVANEAGLSFTHSNGATGDYQLPEIMGSGCAWLDHDGDGDLDAYLVSAGTGEEATNRLFENLGGGRFADCTEAAGVGDRGFGMGCVVGDYDSDGDADLFVTNFGRDALYRNDGDGTFTEVASEAGVAADGWGASGLFVDLDEDGRLDLFVTQYMDHPRHAKQSCSDTAGRTEYCGPHSHFPPVSDLLYHNQGDGTFRDVSLAAGFLGRKAYGLGVVCRDFDGDGRVDLFVANDATPNHLWLNRGGLRFEEQAVERGAAFNLVGLPEAGMGIDSEDVNGDGLWDVFLTHLSTETNTLYLGRSEGAFDDVTPGSGLGRASLPKTGFGTGFLDADLDGDLDLYVANGRVRRGPLEDGVTLASPWHRYAERDLFFERTDKGAGEVAYRDASTEAGTGGYPPHLGRGLALGDYDDDGDVDLLVTYCGGRARLLRNDTPRKGHWLTVRAVENGSDAYGALVTVKTDRCEQHRFLHPARSYLSSSDPRLHFGLGQATEARVTVRWPDGSTTEQAFALDRLVLISKEDAEKKASEQRDPQTGGESSTHD